MKFKIFLLCFIFLIFSPVKVFAQTSVNSFVTVVNPVRGGDFWDLQNQKPEDAVKGELDIVDGLNISPTWLIRFDALSNVGITNLLKKESNQDKGLLLEITPSWTTASGVTYHNSPSWHSAGSVFLTGYSQEDRKKLIDLAFEKFKSNFGYYPKSVGAWWIDSYSLDYMQTKYGISASLIVADQYTTDNYQIWGQYFGTPYYPYKRNALIPAQTPEDKINVVVMQWAARDPVNGYGDGVQESTYSVQANDYLDYHNLDTNYFGKLVDLYLGQKLNNFNQLTVGLENSYSWQKYGPEYKKQMELLSQKRAGGQLSILDMAGFANWYQKANPTVSPPHIISANDPLGSSKKVTWFMNPYYRVGWFYNPDGSVFRDVRQYIQGQDEPCFEKTCEELNFATSATRVLDDVSFKHKYIIDQGKISDFNLTKVGENYKMVYKNEAGQVRDIEFLPRDISIDGKVKTIDAFILNVLTSDQTSNPKSETADLGLYSKLKFSVVGLIFSLFKFLIFLVIGLFIPGFLLVRKIKVESLSLKIFLYITTGFAALTLVAYLSGYLRSFWPVIIYLLINLGIFVLKRPKLQSLELPKLQPGLVVLILAGTFFQCLATFRSGWVYPYGVGYWGPIGHDGVWHQALINQLMKGVPPLNPAFSGTVLMNYHYFFDLLVATTAKLSMIPVLDLLYRFYPVLFSLLLGVGTYFFALVLFKNKWIALLSVYLGYFGSSFGWIVDVIKHHEIGGESAFWANQPVSFNLNPPFAISLLMLIAGFLLFHLLVNHKERLAHIIIPIVLLWGTLIEFKVYAGVIVLGALLIVAFQHLILQRDASILKIVIPTGILAAIVFLPENGSSGSLLVFYPFWFIDTMIDFTDRVGWERLSIGHQAYIQRHEWWKLILEEGLGLTIFTLGNLGTRFLGLFGIIKFFKERLWKIPEYSFIFWMSIISFGLPLLFIQKGNDWNTIQFLYYFIFIISILGAAGLYKLYKILPRGFGLVVTVLILLVTPISSFATFKNGFSNIPPSRLPLEEMDALIFLKSQPAGVVLTFPYNKDTINSNLKLQKNYSAPFPLFSYETTSYVSAFSEKPTFIEDEIQQDILQNDYKKRLVASNDFFNERDLDWSKGFLKDNDIKYIYLPKVFNKSLEEDKLNLKKIFENKDVNIFEVLN